jgi:hypothetical protein
MSNSTDGYALHTMASAYNDNLPSSLGNDIHDENGGFFKMTNYIVEMREQGKQREMLCMRSLCVHLEY